MASSERRSCISKEPLKTLFTKNDSENEEGDDPPFYLPEPKDTEMKISPFCECQNCRHWSQSVDWCTKPNFEFEDEDNKVHRERQVQPLLRTEKYPGKEPKILSPSNKKLSKTEKQSLFKTLVHGEVPVQPVNLLADTYFHEDIQLILQELNYIYSLPIQSFVWPAIFRQLNVFMISGRKSGKTMAYLPAICTFGFHVEQKYQQLSKYKGPLVIIVCSNSKQCEQIFDLIKKIYSKIHIKPKVSIVTYPVSNANNMDILITIPNSLLYCIKSRIFTLKRLCHLIFEDTSNLLKYNQESIYKILDVVNEMLEHRLNNTKVQIIVSSEKWSNDLRKLLKLLYMTPLVCIGNYLEAALYANIQFDVKFLKVGDKKIYVEELLRNKYHIYKTLIICNEDEITDLNKWLVRHGIRTIALTQSSDKEDIDETEIIWNTTAGGEYKVLLCTELIFETCLTINDAMWLIHYSFPSSWTRFTKTFSAMSANYKSPLEPEEIKDKLQCKTFLIIDETCEDKMPKISYLLSRLSKDFPEAYKKYAEYCKIESENAKIRDKKQLCKTLKLFGKCLDPMCNERHTVSEDLDISPDLPKNGKIIFKILNMKDVTHYVVQLIEHADLDGNVRKINNFDLKQPLIYDSCIEKKQAKYIEIGKFYVHCDYTTEGEELRLCQVLTIDSETFVEVKLTTGVTLKTLKKKLYEPPPNLEFVEVYLCNLIPPFKDEQFSGRSYFVTRTFLESKEYKDIVLTANVYLQLDRTLWLNNVVEELNVIDLDVIKFNFGKQLLDLKVVEMCETQITALHKLCTKCGITLPCYVKHTAKAPIKIKEIEVQRSFLDDNINEVILSSAVTPEEFYVRLVKYQCLLETLEKDIQNEVKKGILDLNVKVSVGKYNLARDPKGEMYSRVLILNIQDGKALCYFVDYGDETVVSVADLKHLPSKFITRLPFQAIQCRLHGLSPAFGEWDDEATGVLYKYLLEPESDIFRSFFVKVCDTEKSDSIRVKTKYSVLLKDGFGTKNILMNQLLLDCGFATSVFGKIEDFELSKHESKMSSLDSDSERDEDEDEGEEEIRNILENDFEIFNEEEFLELFCHPSVKEAVQNAIEYKNNNETESSERKPKVVRNQESSTGITTGKPNYLTPEVYWSQTDKTVKLKIKLIGVGEYKTNIMQNRIFTFWTHLDNKVYQLKFTLHKIAEIAKHRAKGQEVEVVLNKVEPVDWLQLTGSNKRMRNIHYEVPNLEEQKSPRKFLQLDITDDETDTEDNIMVHEISDLDSEFDEEAGSSSSN